MINNFSYHGLFFLLLFTNYVFNLGFLYGEMIKDKASKGIKQNVSVFAGKWFSVEIVPFAYHSCDFSAKYYHLKAKFCHSH